MNEVICRHRHYSDPVDGRRKDAWGQFADGDLKVYEAMMP